MAKRVPAILKPSKGCGSTPDHRYEGGKVPKRTCRPNPVTPPAHRHGRGQESAAPPESATYRGRDRREKARQKEGEMAAEGSTKCSM